MKTLLAFIFSAYALMTHAQDSTLFRPGNILLIHGLGFEVGRSEFDLNEGMVQLTRLGLAMRKMPGMKVRVDGHTSPVGDPRLNMKLSNDRAKRVKGYLVGLGIDKKRITTKGFGGTQPISDTDQQLNRRIEIRILENPTMVSLVTKKSEVTDSLIVAKAPVQQEKKQLKKVALLIGNSNYADVGKLKNPVHDVELMSRTLERLHFDVYEHKNQNYKNMMEAIREFSHKIDGADVVFFYYAGHGLQHQGNNYLLPVDVKLEKGPVDLQFQAINAELILRGMEYTNKESLNIIVLDACRSNPFVSWARGGNSGLAELKPPSGSIIAYATSPGAVAFDGEGENGVYTSALSSELLKAQRLEDVFMNTRIKVEEATKGSQSPWELFRLRGVYVLTN